MPICSPFTGKMMKYPGGMIRWLAISHFLLVHSQIPAYLPKHIERLIYRHKPVGPLSYIFCNMSHITFMHIRQSRVDGVDKLAFMCLKRLTYLKLEGCGIVDLPDGVFKSLSQLRELSLSSKYHFMNVAHTAMNEV